MLKNPADEFIYTTVRIEADKPDGTHSGTGFIFNFCADATHHVPCIVTNKHVIRSASVGRFVLNLAGDDNLPVSGETFSVTMNQFEAAWILHPDPQIDLAVMPLAYVIDHIGKNRKKPFYRAFAMEGVADDAFLEGLSAIEDIIMIGYPNGLWDQKNNRPLIRRGITATPVYDNYQGRPVFVIDCACYGGSSGSPVILYNPSGYTAKDGSMVIGRRIKLLGVLFEGPHLEAEGTIVMKPVPTQKLPVAVTKVMLNLGHCVKATALAWFETHLASIA